MAPKEAHERRSEHIKKDDPVQDHPLWHPHAESNHEQRFRKPPLYPFNYEGICRADACPEKAISDYFFFLFFCAFLAFSAAFLRLASLRMRTLLGTLPPASLMDFGPLTR